MNIAPGNFTKGSFPPSTTDVVNIQRQDIKIVPGDKVEIRGSRITYQGKPAIIAAEVKKGEEILKLRDEKGFPVWSGWRRR